MVRIAGVDLPSEKRILYALPYIYGIGLSRSKKILEATGVDPMKKVKELTEQEISAIRQYIAKEYIVEGDLRKQVTMNIKALIEMKCYRGLRHKVGLPVRGQKTHCNARSWKGHRRSVLGKKKKRQQG